MNTTLIEVIHSLSGDVAEAQYEADVLEAVVKQNAKDEDMFYASFMAQNAGDRYKQWASSSTPSGARKAIEAEIIAKFSYKPLHNLLQDQIDLAAAQQRVRQLRAELTAYTMRYYGEFADAFGTMQRVFAHEQLHGVAQANLPLVPTPGRTPPPPPGAKPWEKSTQ